MRKEITNLDINEFLPYLRDSMKNADKLLSTAHPFYIDEDCVERAVDSMHVDKKLPYAHDDYVMNSFQLMQDADDLFNILKEIGVIVLSKAVATISLPEVVENGEVLFPPFDVKCEYYYLAEQYR